MKLGKKREIGVGAEKGRKRAGVEWESMSRVRTEKIHGKQEWSKEGKGDLESRSGVRIGKIYL